MWIYSTVENLKGELIDPVLVVAALGGNHCQPEDDAGFWLIEFNDCHEFLDSLDREGHAKTNFYYNDNGVAKVMVVAAEMP